MKWLPHHRTVSIINTKAQRNDCASKIGRNKSLPKPTICGPRP